MIKQYASIMSRRHVLAGLAAGSSLAACDMQSSRAMRAADTHPIDYPTVRAVAHMGDLLAARTGGRLRIKIYAGSQLGAERDTLEITAFGGIDLNRVNLAPLNSIEPLTIVPSLPFLFRSKQHMRSALDGAPGRVILDSLAAHDLIGLCFYDFGERSFYNTQRPINTPDDMAGLKIRVQNSDLYVAMIKALGADATPMPLGEVYQSLAQGVVDGAENNWPSYDSGRHFEVARYYSLTRHVMAPEVLVMSRRYWESLTADDQDLVRETAIESVNYMRLLWDERVEKSKARILSAGVAVNEITDLSLFTKKMEPIWQQFVKTDLQKKLVADIVSMEVGL